MNATVNSTRTQRWSAASACRIGQPPLPFPCRTRAEETSTPCALPRDRRACCKHRRWMRIASNLLLINVTQPEVATACRRLLSCHRKCCVCTMNPTSSRTCAPSCQAGESGSIGRSCWATLSRPGYSWLASRWPATGLSACSIGSTNPKPGSCCCGRLPRQLASSGPPVAGFPVQLVPVSPRSRRLCILRCLPNSAVCLRR
ncbi:hypothetical protein D9M72_491360 [compost metagenome]